MARSSDSLRSEHDRADLERPSNGLAVPLVEILLAVLTGEKGNVGVKQIKAHPPGEFFASAAASLCAYRVISSTMASIT